MACSRGRVSRAAHDRQYTRAYAVAGSLTAAAVLASNVLSVGGTTVAPLVAGGFTTIGWQQANQKLPHRVRWSYRWVTRFAR